MPSVPSHQRGRSSGWLSVQVIAWMRSRAAASGADPTGIADEPASIWRAPTVEARTGLSRSTLYRLAATGQFPRPIHLAARSSERDAA